MQTAANSPVTNATIPVRQGKGCFYYGCLTIVIGILVLAIGGYFVLKHYEKIFVAEYTSDSPMKLADDGIQENEYKAARSKIEEFANAVKDTTEARKLPPPLTLTARDLNSLIQYDPEFRQFKDRLHLEIKDDIVSGQVNISLEPLGYSNKWVNGETSLRISFDYSVLFVGLHSLTVNGKSIPETVMKHLREENLARDFGKTPEQEKTFEHIKSIAVKNGVVTITPK